MDNYCRVTYASRLAGFPTSSRFDNNVDNAQVSELCHHENGDCRFTWRDSSVAWKSVGAWLHGSHDCDIINHSEAQSPTLRIVWLDIRTDTVPLTTSAPKADLMQLLDQIGVTPVYNLMGTAFIVHHMQESMDTQTSGRTSYAFAWGQTSMALWLVWSHDKISGSSQAVCWAPPGVRQRLIQAIISFSGAALQHPLALALISSLAAQNTAELHLNIIGRELTSIERSTGYHIYSEDALSQLPGPFSASIRDLSSSASGMKSGLADVHIQLEVLKELLTEASRLITNQNVSLQAGQLDPGSIQLLQCINLALKQLRLDALECQAFMTRSEAQLTAIFHLITQEDTKQSMTLAQSSLSMAADSRALAEAATRDAKAMKTLAIVTMVYLPPTAIATIFGMPFFDWRRSGPGPLVTDRFWIYWVTSIPLTALTLLVWWIWIKRGDDFKTVMDRLENRIKREQGHATDARASLDQDLVRVRTKPADPNAQAKDQVNPAEIPLPQQHYQHIAVPPALPSRMTFPLDHKIVDCTGLAGVQGHAMPQTVMKHETWPAKEQRETFRGGTFPV